MKHILLATALLFTSMSCNQTSVKETGTQGKPCNPDNTCNPGLICDSNICIKSPDSTVPKIDSGIDAAYIQDANEQDFSQIDTTLPDTIEPDSPLPDASLPDTLSPDSIPWLDAGNNPYAWVISMGDTSYDEGLSIAVDTTGNVYVTGTYRYYPSFGTTTLTWAGYSDIFVTKISSSGQHLWTNSINGAGGDYGEGIAVDTSGNVYVTGYFASTVSIGGGIQLSSSGGSDIFVAKYNTNGNAQWAKSGGGAASTNADQGHGIALDVSNNVYITGYYGSNALFGSIVLPLKGGKNDIFVAKYGSNGQIKWAKSAGGSDDDNAKSIAVDRSGNAYITGKFSSSNAAFGTTTLSSSGTYNMFVAKFDSNGQPAWAQSGTGTNTIYGQGIAIGPIGDVYVAGTFNNNAIFGSTTLTTKGSYDIFVAKYDKDGQYQWVSSDGAGNIDYANAIAVDANDIVYVVGQFQGSVSPLVSKGAYDIFLAKVTSHGSISWNASAGGTDDDIGYAIAVDTNGNAYLTGRFNGKSFFPTKVLYSQGAQDIFVWKLPIP